jgi:hypothetical protein
LYEIKCIQSWNDSRITHLLLNQSSINQFLVLFFLLYDLIRTPGFWAPIVNFICYIVRRHAWILTVLLLSNTTVIRTKFTTQQKLQNTDAENEAFWRSIKILYCIEQWCSPMWGPFVVHPVVTYRGIHEHRCCQTPIIQPACHLDLFTISCEWLVRPNIKVGVLLVVSSSR